MFEIHSLINVLFRIGIVNRHKLMYMSNLFSHLTLEALCVGAMIVCVGGKGMVSKEINKGQ